MVIKVKEKKLSPTLVLVIFSIGLLLKVALAFSLPVYHDVGWYISLLEYHVSAFMNLIVLEHPPLGYSPYLLFLELFGLHDFVLRFVPLIFGLLELFTLYLVAKKWFGKRTADCTIILFSILYFATINTLSPEGDGSIMGFFSLLFFYCLSEHYDYLQRFHSEKDYSRKSTLFLFLSGFFLGILLLIKVRAILFFIPCILYSVYRTRNIFTTIKVLFPLCIISLLIFAIFPL